MALYRICQEALTNVFKHAGPGARTVVAQEWGEAEVRLSITNEGGGGAGSTADPLAGHGLGLLGMRERAELVGGSLTAAPTDEGFYVQAVLPFSGVPAGQEEAADE